MNFHKDNVIMRRLREHYDEACGLIPEDRIVGVFLQGSQNYGLDYEGSDVDSKCIVLPTLEDIIFNQKAVSTTHIRANDEHIDLKDIRLMFQTFRKQNMNFVEILFTEYKIINPLYEDLWNELIAQNELVGRYNPHRAVTTMKGIASEKFHALEHRYPSRVEVIDKFGGYDSKQLHHLLRIEDFLERYINGETYAECLKPKGEMSMILKYIKQFGVKNLEEARQFAEESFDRISKMANEYRETHLDEGNPAVDELLDNVQRKIMKKSILMELAEDVYDEFFKTASKAVNFSLEELFKEHKIRKELAKHD